MVQMDLENTILVTHKNCLDGVGCVLMFLHRGGKRENVVYLNPGNRDKFILESEEVASGKPLLFADIGVSCSEHADALEKRGNVVLLDHHKTSSHLSGRTWCTIDMDACGTELLRRFLGVDDKFLNRLAATIDDHDRWIMKIPEGDSLNLLFKFMGQERFIDSFALRNIFYPDELLLEHESKLIEVLKENRAREIENVLSRVTVRRVSFKGRQVKMGFVFHSTDHTSYVLHEMLNRIPSIEAAAQVSLSAGVVALRSRTPGFDVAEFASSFAVGGGHAGAAGHNIDRKKLSQMVLEEIYGV